MAQVITFDGRNIIEPGAYSRIVGGETNPPDSASFGNVLIIDTGRMAGWGWGSGISGENASGANSIFRFNTIEDFRAAVGGGDIWDASKWLFKPSKDLAFKGVNAIYLVHARTTKRGVRYYKFNGVGVAATGTVTYTVNLLNNDTITLNGVVYTFKSSPTASTDVKIATTLSGTLQNLVEKVAQSSNGSVTLATYSHNGTVFTITYNESGTVGNAYTLAASVGTVSGATLSGGSGAAGTNGGTITVYTKAEGIRANGVINLTSTEIERGFAMNVVAGTANTSALVFEFYRGTFTGNDIFGVPFNNVNAEDAEMELIAKSPEFTNLQDFINWANQDINFRAWFVLDSSSAIAGTGALVAADITAQTGLRIFQSGSEVYNAGDLNTVFQHIKELDYSFVLADKDEFNAESSENLQILAHIQNESEFGRIMVIGGGPDLIDDSITAAETFDHKFVHVVHSRTYKAITTGSGLREYPTIYHAAAVLGRMAGQEPQVPVTFKELDFDGVKNELTQTERENAIQHGVMHQRFVQGLGWVINQDINTKQENTLDVYEDGSSPHGSIMRIALLLNKELTIDLRTKFTGLNANLASPADIKAAVEGRLNFRVASKTDDDLILSYRNVRVTLNGADYKVEYGFVPNGPVNRLFITGFMFNVNLTA